MNTELVLDVANGDTTITLVVDEHGKTTTVLGAFLRTCQYQVDVGVAIGDETFHAVETPCAVLILCSLQHHALQVGTCIWLGQVHTHGLACANARDVLLTLFLRTELIEGVDTALE